MSQTANEVKSIIKEWTTQQMSGIHTALPATVISYSPSSNRASCQPAGSMQTDDGRRIAYPVIHNIPVVFPLGLGGGAGVTFPVKSGDGCLLVFSESQVDDFLSGGMSKDMRRHSLNDGICIPGLYSAGVSPGAAHPDDVCIFNKGSLLTLGDGGFAGTLADGTTFRFAGGNCVVNGVGATTHTHTGVHGETTTGHG